MNGACESQPEQLCGCCAGVGHETPQPISNRPGLTSVAYRVCTHGTFKASMLTALSDPEHSAQAALRTPATPDFTIPPLDRLALSPHILTSSQSQLPHNP